MALWTFGGTPSDVLTDASGNVVPDYPVLVVVANTGEIISTLFEMDGTTPISQLRSNPVGSTAPGAIRGFKCEFREIEYRYNDAGGNLVKWYQAGRELSTTAFDAAEAATTAADAATAAATTATTTANNAMDAAEVAQTAIDTGVGMPNLEVVPYVRHRVNRWDALHEGAAGNGTTDDAASINATIGAMAPFDELYFRPDKTFLINSALNVDKAMKVSGYGAILKSTDQNVHQINITASDVAVEGLRLQGAQYATYVGNGGTGIWAFAPNWAGALERLTFKDLKIDTQPFVGIYTKWGKEHHYRNVNCENLVYGGIIGLSIQGAGVHSCRVKNVTKGSATQPYGISFTRWSLDSLAVSPKSRDIAVIDCTVEDVGWEAIETHGADGMRIIGNRVRRCLFGIAGVPCPDPGGVDIYSPNNMQIIGNVIDSEVTDGTKNSGITVVGADQTGAGEQYAYGCIIANNVINRMGSGAASGLGVDTNVIGGGIRIYWTRGALIANNVIIEPSHFGIVLYQNNLDTVLQGNTIIDPWSNTAVTAAAIAIRGANNTWTVQGNRLIRANKTATTVAAYGQYMSTTTGCTWSQGGGNQFAAATTPYNGTTVAQQSLFTNAPVVRPVVTGSRGANAALASLLTGLDTLGAITNSSTA
jgi:hypothetical protein